jgi:MarR family transcriptional regulator, 2-MHQ and catechol-resistance regulon repressor
MKSEDRVLKLTTVLFRLNQFLQDSIKKDILSYDINVTEFGTLEVLYHKGALPIQTVCDKMLMANSSMTYVVDKMVKRGFIEKIADQVDRRVTNVALTKKGHSFFESIFPKHIEQLKNLYQDLNEDEIETLMFLGKKVGKRAQNVVESK